MNAGDENFVGHDSAGGQHLGPADDQTICLTRNNARRQERISLLGRTLGAVSLRIDDDVSQIEIVVARMAIIVSKSLCTFGIISLEHIEPHEHSRDAGCDMVRRAAHESRMKFGPCLKALTALDQRVVAARQFPYPVGAGSGLSLERHEIAIFRRALEVEHTSD